MQSFSTQTDYNNYTVHYNTSVNCDVISKILLVHNTLHDFLSPISCATWSPIKGHT